MSDLISNVKIFPVKANSGSLLANASFVVADAFCLKCKVVKTSKGMMVSQPSDKYIDKDGQPQYPEFHFPITKEAREEMIEKVMAEYEKQTSGSKQAGGESKPSKSKGGLPF